MTIPVYPQGAVGSAQKTTQINDSWYFTEGVSVVNGLVVDNLQVTGTQIYSANTTLTNLEATGTAVLDTTLEVKGAATLDTTLEVKGAATCDTTLHVTGAATLAGGAAVTGASTFSSTLSAVGITDTGTTQLATLHLTNPLTSAYVDPALLQYVAVPISASDLIAMNGVPKQLIASPGANKTIILHKALFRMTRTATQFTGGGNAVIQYGDSTAAIATIAAAVITGTAGTSDVVRAGADVTAPEASALSLTNASAAFAAGTGTGVMHLWYSIV